MAEKRLTHTITVDLAKETWSSRPVLVQNSDNTFLITVLNDGEPADLSDVRDIVLAVIPSRKKANDSVFSPGVKVGSTSQVKIDLGRAAVATPGIVQAQLKLTGTNGGLISSTSFNFEVQMDAGLNFQPSENELTLIETVLGDGPTVLANATQTIADMESTQATLTGAVGGAISSLNEDKAAAIEELDTAKTTAVNELAEVREANRFRQLNAVATVAERDSTYPNPEHGDTVRVTSDATMYKYDKDAGWVVSDRYEATAVDALNQQLADTSSEVSALETTKMDKNTTDIAVTQINKNRGKIDQTFLADELLQQMAGTTPVNAVPAPLSITQDKLAEKSVHSHKTDFISHSSNLFNKDDIVENARIASLTGELDFSTNQYSVSGFIPVLPNTTYTGNNIARKAFYGQNREFISSDTVNGTFASPANAFYIKIQIAKGMQFTTQLNVGNTLLPYESYRRTLSQDINVALENDSIESRHIQKQAVSPVNTDFLVPSNNLFNKEDIVVGKVISATGAISNNADYAYSHEIEIDDTSKYTMSPVTSVAFYDADKTFRRRIDGETDAPLVITPQTGDKYIRLNFKLSGSYINFDLFQVNKGDSLSDYEKYGYKFTNAIVGVPQENEENNEEVVKNKDAFVVNGVLEGYYEQTDTLPPREVLNAQSVYDFYDGIMGEYPNYVSKSQIGSSVNGVPIYRYDFKPHPVEVSEDVMTPKVLVVSGTHGTEKMSVEVARHTFSQIARKWKEDDYIDTLRWNVHFIVVPILNPDGWGVPERRNANLVDINRQFPAGWISSDPTSSSYGGTAPLTQPEAIALKGVIDSEDDLIYVCDFHNFSSRTDPSTYYQFVWNAAGTVFNMNLAKSLLVNISKEFKKKMDFVPQDDTTYFGYTSWTPGGSIAAYAASLGIQSSTFELSQSFPYGEDNASYSSTAMTLGVEVFTNWLILNLKNNIRHI